MSHDLHNSINSGDMSRDVIIQYPTEKLYTCNTFKVFTIKAAFHLRVFYTHVHARKNLNPSTVRIFEKYFHR